MVNSESFQEEAGCNNDANKLFNPKICKPRSLKLKLSKLFSTTQQQSYLINTSEVVLKKSPNLSESPHSNNSLGKSIFSNKIQSECNARHEDPAVPARRKVNPYYVIDPYTSTSAVATSQSSSSTSSFEQSFDTHNNCGEVNFFNSLNVANSPRLSRNAQRAKLNIKRQQNEEKRIDKQRREQRLRTSQDLLIKLNEIGRRKLELEKDGNHLEVKISGLNSMIKSDENKVKLEQELYGVIHQKNLLARCENKLNIQCRALRIEDKLSECQQNLRDLLKISETEKTIEQIESEKKIMEQIVQYVEEKNRLVEQLESLRLL